MVQREILAIFEGKQKEAITPKPERSRPPKLVCMRFTSTSTCINFLSQLYFLTPMDYSPWFEGKFWPFLKANEKGAKSLKLVRPHSPKLVCKHISLISTIIYVHVFNYHNF